MPFLLAGWTGVPLEQERFASPVAPGIAGCQAEVWRRCFPGFSDQAGTSSRFAGSHADLMSMALRLAGFGVRDDHGPLRHQRCGAEV